MSRCSCKPSRRMKRSASDCWHRPNVAAADGGLPAYDYCIKSSHVFNLLDAHGAIRVAERTGYIARVRALARQCAERYLDERAAMGHPLLIRENQSREVGPASLEGQSGPNVTGYGDAKENWTPERCAEERQRDLFTCRGRVAAGNRRGRTSLSVHCSRAGVTQGISRTSIQRSAAHLSICSHHGNAAPTHDSGRWSGGETDFHGERSDGAIEGRRVRSNRSADQSCHRICCRAGCQLFRNSKYVRCPKGDPLP